MNRNELIDLVVDGLDSGPFMFSPLHQDLDPMTIESDLDIAVSRPTAEVLGYLAPRLLDRDVHLIMAVQYDSGDSVAAFFASSDVGSGLQLDLIHDPEGLGRYGLRTTHLLQRAKHQNGRLVLHPDDVLIYRIRKRFVKGQWDRMEPLLARARGENRRRLEESIEAILLQRPARATLSLLDGRRPACGFRTARAVSEVQRRGRRILEPVGAWIHIPDSQVAHEVSRRFARVLPASRHFPRAPGGPVWYLRSVAPARIRPGLFFSSGQLTTGRLSPDLVVASPDRESAVGEILLWLTRRTHRILGVPLA